MSLRPGMTEKWEPNSEFGGDYWMYTVSFEGSDWKYARLFENDKAKDHAGIMEFYHDDAWETFKHKTGAKE
jgi:hypothetical protein